MPDEREWNYDRIVSAQAQVRSSMEDMTRVLHSGRCAVGVRQRMVRLLRGAADEIESMAVICDAQAADKTQGS